ncbi:hypothetical protein ACP70R_007559 [Stipagrostis hirtigluma subsp. patula]
MACLSPSPSGRRLSELLEEKQEPFFLDLHLLEKGCSSSLLDGYDTALCWPAAGNDAAAVLKRLTSKKSKSAARKKKQQPQQPAGLLRLLLSKILHGKAANRKPAALQFSDSFKMASPAAAAVAPSPCAKHLDAVKTAAEVKEQETVEYSDCYSDSDSDDEKQLSPVSVLEHPFESSPVHGKLSPSKNAMNVFRELLDAGYSPALLTQLLAKSDDLLKDTAAAADDDEDDYYYGRYRTSPKNRRGGGDDSAAYWEAHRAELAKVSELVASEVPSSRLGAADVRTEREDIAADVEAAVFEALLRELVMDLC